jgi:DNA-directed RNA polymerase III subunit RPC8
MFVIALIADTIYVPPQQLSTPSISAVSSIIEQRYPNRIIVNVGLVICPYGPPISVGDGVLVPGDGGSHHQVLFNIVVFRPFVEEVLVGTVTSCIESGITVSVGQFFEHVFIPAYWMLNPSIYDATAKCWVWTPNYDDDDGEGNEEGEGEEEGENGITTTTTTTTTTVKREEMIDDEDAPIHNNKTDVGVAEGGEDTDTNNRFEIVIGSEIRFKVKAVNFTRITNTMKGVQATTTSSLSSHMSGTTTPTAAASQHQSSSSSSTDAKGIQQNGIGNGGSSNGLDIIGSSSNNGIPLATNGGIMVGNPDDNHGSGNTGAGAVRMRSTSIDISNDTQPAPMQIVGSICEDGLGLISWWKSTAGEDDEEEVMEAEYDEEEEEECYDDDMEGNGMTMEED